jgi:phosphoribosylanthranilate isomerase
MTVQAKICGLCDQEAMQAALDNGADFVGLVFYPPSPRNLALADAVRLADMARGRASIVALVVNADDKLIDEINVAVRPDFFQLHGDESPDRCREIARRTGCRLIKAVKIASRADAEAGLEYETTADIILFDAKVPKDTPGGLPGGNGIAFDWRMLETVKERIPFMLSGGLTPANVAAAVTMTGAAIVDVSSGVERAPGHKDPGRIRQFLAVTKSL